jgi:hypothetical protein
MYKPRIKLFTLAAAFALVLGACSFTAAPTNTPEPTTDLNVVATQVAEKVVAGLTATAASWTATPSITPTFTTAPIDANAPTATITPTETETPTLTPATDLLAPSVTPILAGATVTPNTGADIFNDCYNSQLVSDVTVPRGEEYLPGSVFVKTWEIKNIGTCTWNDNYSIAFGYSTPVHDFYNISTSFSKSETKPGETVQVSITITLPTGYPEEGAYNIGYRLTNDKGYSFGAWFFVYVSITPPTPTPKNILYFCALVTAGFPKPAVSFELLTAL